MKKLLLIMMSCCSISAFAALGDKVSVPNTNNNTNQVNGSKALSIKAATPQQPYTTMTTDTNGVIVTEYINSNNYVFAVSWKGPVKPDLVSLLGSYAPLTQKGSYTTRTHLDVKENDIVVHSTGRLRNFSGYAYIPSLTPANFNITQ